MDIVVSSIPLFHLPSNAILKVLRDMDTMQQIGFSLISDRAKNLIRALNLEAFGFRVTIAETIRIDINFLRADSISLHFYSEGNGNHNIRIVDPPMKLGTCGVCQVSYFDNQFVQPDIQQWEMKGSNLRDWIDHCSAVLNQSEIDDFTLQRDMDRYDFNSLQETIKRLKVDSLTLNFTGFYKYSEMIMKAFQSFKNLTIIHEPFKNIYEISMQNVQNLYFMLPRQLTLNDLLICNSQSLGIFFDGPFSCKILNQFLKHWIRGSNPRMDRLCIQIQGFIDLDQNVILNGIDYRVVPAEEKRSLQSRMKGTNYISYTYFYGGFDILRNDGTVANIRMEWDEDDGSSTFQFSVWR